jgi:hypothetical protein
MAKIPNSLKSKSPPSSSRALQTPFRSSYACLYQCVRSAVPFDGRALERTQGCRRGGPAN